MKCVIHGLQNTYVDREITLIQKFLKMLVIRTWIFGTIAVESKYLF